MSTDNATTRGTKRTSARAVETVDAEPVPVDDAVEATDTAETVTAEPERLKPVEETPVELAWTKAAGLPRDCRSPDRPLNRHQRPLTANRSLKRRGNRRLQPAGRWRRVGI